MQTIALCNYASAGRARPDKATGDRPNAQCLRPAYDRGRDIDPTCSCHAGGEG
jgi:hypothetical protein